MEPVKNRSPFSRQISIAGIFPILLSFVIGITASVLLFMRIYNWEKQDTRMAFEYHAKINANTVRHHLRMYLDVLFVLGDYYNNSEYITRNEFSTFVQSTLGRYPGIQALSWNPLVMENERETYERKAQKEGVRDFQFTQKNEQGNLVRAASRQEYVVVYYISPLEQNIAELGFDIASDSVRMAAVREAFDTGKPVVTPRITLVPGNRSQYGVLIFLPIYHPHVKQPRSGQEKLLQRKGCVVEVLRLGKVIEKALMELSDRQLQVFLFDVSDSSKGYLLFATKPGILSNDQTNSNLMEQGLFWSETIHFAGREWKMVIQPGESHFQAYHRSSWISLFLALLITVSISYYLFTKLKYTVEIEQRIKEQTRTNTLLETKITERNHAEAALKESEQLFKAIFHQAFQFSVILDTTGKILDLNQLCRDVCGDLTNGATGSLLWEAAFWCEFPEVVEKTKTAIRKALDLGYATDEVRFLDKDRHIREGIRIFSSIKDEQGKVKLISLAGLDISRRKQIEKEKQQLKTQLHQAQKMEAVGTLAGGVAHDFNNILGIIIGNAELALADTRVNSPVHESLTEIHIAGIRAKEVVGQLLSFSRKSEQEMVPTDISFIVKESIKLLRSSTPANIEFQTRLPKNGYAILADSIQIHQILINLCTNAVHAMLEDGGRIMVELDNREITADDADPHSALPAGKYLQLKIEDSGFGMPPDILDRIFEPYFTTKEVGKGSGIGLAAVHGIVKRHKAYINVKSSPGNGTVFYIHFPALEDKISSLPVVDETIPGGDGHLLFLDDEQSITGVAKKILEKLGYTVDIFNDPETAVDYFCGNFEKFDGVITDMAMPKMTGDIFIKKIKKIMPSIPVILCTGYSDKLSRKSSQDVGAAEIILKPVDMKTLARAIRAALKK